MQIRKERTVNYKLKNYLLLLIREHYQLRVPMMFLVSVSMKTKNTDMFSASLFFIFRVASKTIQALAITLAIFLRLNRHFLSS